MSDIEIKTILYATDFSESSVPACDYARKLCQLTGARLKVLHVIGELTDDRRSLMPPQALAQLEKELEIQSVKEMERFCADRFGDKVAYDTETIIGNPFQEIIKASEKHAVDMIIMGTHGRTGIEHVIVGSTAERVVRKSAVPVLTVRTRS